MKVMIAMLVGFITLSYAGVAAAGSRCDTGNNSTHEQRQFQTLSNASKAAHDIVKHAISNIR